jgi:TonB family protein
MRSTLHPRHPGSTRFINAGSLLASLIAHAVLVGAGAVIVGASWGARDPASAERAPVPEVFELDTEALRLPGADSSADSAVRPSLEAAQPETGGGRRLARPDMERAGRGGSRNAEAPAVNLADRNDGLRLSRELVSRIDRDQLQRLATSRDRASNDDRRSTTHPMELFFLATGPGQLDERRPVAASNPSRGVQVAPSAGVVGSTLGALALPPGGDDLPLRVLGGLPGVAHSSPGVGILRGERSNDHRSSAAVALGRPLVAEAAPSVPSNRAGTARDTVDSEQEVAATVQSLVHASTAGGLPGGGAGGEEGPGPAGSQGTTGAGSRAGAFGSGQGPYRGTDDRDPRILGYWRAVRAKIWPLWEHAFPKSAALDGRQGLATVSVVIWADGHIEDVRIVRPSGIPEFDANVRDAVLRAAPFPPFPPTIQAEYLRRTIAFDMTNPTVR